MISIYLFIFCSRVRRVLQDRWECEVKADIRVQRARRERRVRRELRESPERQDLRVRRATEENRYKKIHRNYLFIILLFRVNAVSAERLVSREFRVQRACPERLALTGNRVHPDKRVRRAKGGKWV